MKIKINKNEHIVSFEEGTDIFNIVIGQACREIELENSAQLRLIKWLINHVEIKD